MHSGYGIARATDSQRAGGRYQRAVDTPAVSPADLRERVDKALHEFLQRAVAPLAGVSADLAPFGAVTEAFVLDGGKRLRPAFCYWGHRAAGGEDSDELVRAAASLELLQACALVHDDVIDSSDTRRGAPSVHRRVAGLPPPEGGGGGPAGRGAAPPPPPRG